MKRNVLGQARGNPVNNADVSTKRWQRQGRQIISEWFGTPRHKVMGIALLMLLFLLLWRVVRSVLADRRLPAGSSQDPAEGLAGGAGRVTGQPAVERQASIPAGRRPAAGKRTMGNQRARTAPRPKGKMQPQRRWWRKPGRWLVLLEVLAVIFVLVTGTAAWVSLQDLNETYRSLHRAGPQLLPTLGAAANPDLAAVARVRPGAPEAPVDFLPAAGAMAAPALPTPPPTITPASPAAPATGDAVAEVEPTPVPDYARHIRIPAIDVDSPVFPSDEPLALKLGVAQFGYVTEPGQPGNLVLAAHNDSYGEIFRHLEDLEQGDEVTLFGKHSSYRYRVREKRIVNPEDVWVTLPTPRSTITLITCYPYLIDTHRLVVFAELEE